MVVQPIFIIAGVLILLVSLILTAAFFVLNDRLESENQLCALAAALTARFALKSAKKPMG